MDYLNKRKHVLKLCLKSDENLDMMEDMILKDKIWKIEKKIQNLKESGKKEKQNIYENGNFVLFNVKELQIKIFFFRILMKEEKLLEFLC